MSSLLEMSEEESEQEVLTLDDAEASDEGTVAATSSSSSPPHQCKSRMCVWNATKKYILGPMFIGAAVGFGICVGRALFFSTMERWIAFIQRAGSRLLPTKWTPSNSDLGGDAIWWLINNFI